MKTLNIVFNLISYLFVLVLFTETMRRTKDKETIEILYKVFCWFSFGLLVSVVIFAMTNK